MGMTFRMEVQKADFGVLDFALEMEESRKYLAWGT